MPIYFLPETPEDRQNSELWDYWERTKHERDAPCWLCRRQSRKTLYGRLCWECQQTRPVWDGHMGAILRAEYERRALAYAGPCVSCVKRLAAGDFECVSCREKNGGPNT